MEYFVWNIGRWYVFFSCFFHVLCLHSCCYPELLKKVFSAYFISWMTCFQLKRKRTGYGMSRLALWQFANLQMVSILDDGVHIWTWRLWYQLQLYNHSSIRFIHLQTFANISATFQKGHECSTFSMHHRRLQERGGPKKGEPGIRLMMAIWSLASIIEV